MHYFKTLRHKTKIDTFGAVGDLMFTFYVYEVKIPILLVLTTSMESIATEADKLYPDQYDAIRKKLEDFDLVDVEIFFDKK